MSLVGASSVTTMPHPVRRTVTTSVSPERDAPDHPAFSLDGAKTRPCTVALREERPGFRELRLRLPTLRGGDDRLESLAARAQGRRNRGERRPLRRELSSRRLGLGEVARQLALLLCERGRSARLRLAQRPAVGSERRREDVGLPRSLVESPAAVGDHDAKPGPATSSAATARRRQSSARPLFARDAVGQHPDDEHEHERDNERRHADGPAPRLPARAAPAVRPERTAYVSIGVRRPFLTRIRK